MECSEANVKKVKKSLNNKINREESILECATVKLSICSPQTGKIFRSMEKEGILCVIVDRNKSCLYLKQYDLIEFKLIFSIELYTNIADGYTVCGIHFHTIEFPGFFLGLSFPILDNPNIENRSSLIQKAIISTSKFISIKLSEFVYLHQFDNKKGVVKRANKINKTINNSFKGEIASLSSNELKINNNNAENEINKSNNKLTNINDNNNNINNNKEKDENTPEGKDNEINNNINNNNINNNEENNNNIISNNNNNDNNMDEKTEEEKEKIFFDNIIIKDAPDTKIYKIVQYHLIREKMKVVKKLYQKNFERFIDPNKISFEVIKDYKITTYDFLNDVYSSSDEGEEQKTFVDYDHNKDMISDLENAHIDDEDDRLKELLQKRNNLKEIMKKNDDENSNSIFKTTAIHDE